MACPRHPANSFKPRAVSARPARGTVGRCDARPTPAAARLGAAVRVNLMQHLTYGPHAARASAGVRVPRLPSGRRGAGRRG
ncbi:MAG: hypothetical protein AVDCRST_MAG64-2812 [uncultured Phycisphaerae bacterium]|uniref:Uncharacterized protein n=1 Tax=uncultured Phycisphaerae bacterium TaxID=904963 RepID=A0A6J4PPD8_9BACT|nr:MAG: hypothetical protein AVDCRST_MAG64-2812 [uncultured Phycisphaerae bacterium]